MKRPWKSISVGLLALAALLLTFKLKAVLGWSPDLILPVLAVAGFTLDAYALAFLAFLTAWILNWQAGFPAEIWVLLAVPFSAWLGKRFLPSMPWLTFAAVVVAGECILYLLAGSGIFLGNIGFIISNITFALFFGLALLALLEWVHERE